MKALNWFQRVCQGASIAAVAGLVACAEKSKEQPQAGGSESRPTNAAEDRRVVLFSWDEYFKPEVLEKFTERTGIEVVYATFDNTDEMQEQLKSNPGAYDVIVADDLTLKLLAQKRMLLDLDRDKVSNLVNVGERWRKKDDKFSAPYMWGTTLLAYRSDKIDSPEESWGLLFDPAYQGKVSMLEERLEVFAAALYASGSTGNSSDPVAIGEATEKLLDLVNESDVRFGSDNDMKEHLRSGKSWVAQMYSGDAALIADPAENPEENIAFFIPKEGASTWIDSFAIPRDSLRSDAAHQFIDYMLEGEVAAESSNYLWYATPNVAATPFLEDELASDTTIFPPEDVLAKCRFLDPGDVARERLINLSWGRVQRAYRERSAARKTVASDEGELAATAEIEGGEE